jgi:steroid delta-isomerase-like uncharacterized protein
MSGAESVVRAYYAAFNAGDVEAFLDLLADDVVHGISQGDEEVGKPAFARFMAHMNTCYREQIADLVVLTEPTGTRAAAEFTVHGVYIATDPGVPPGTPPANNQSYVLPAGAFFTIREGKVLRVSNHYNLRDWVRLIAAQE